VCACASAGSVLKKEEVGACVRGRESPCRAFTGSTRRRMGHEVNDEDRRRGCARVLMDTRGGHWRDIRSGGGRSARRGDAERAPARCSSKQRYSEHGQERPVGKIKIAKACSVSLRDSPGGPWRDVLGRGVSLENGQCPWRSRATRESEGARQR
jgi:hypothetical protein